MHASAAHDPARRRPPTPALGKLAIASAIYYAVAVLILHVVQRDLDPIDHFMSEYVRGPGGFVMTTTFFVWALGIAGLAVALRRRLDLAARGKVGLVLLWIGALGIAGAGTFATDAGEPVTTAGVLHVLSGLLGLPALGVGLLLVSLGFRRNDRWRSLAPLAVTLALLFLAGFLSIMFVFADGPGSGLVQRVAIGTVLVWMAVVGHRMGPRDPERRA
ncbi:MAG TPA: DUF998 domain-containing protein [Gemmatimonadota bacterium]|nr:DUF998 domain-containing protein [Gemmatimonadota bacterium]